MCNNYYNGNIKFYIATIYWIIFLGIVWRGGKLRKPPPPPLVVISLSCNVTVHWESKCTIHLQDFPNQFRLTCTPHAQTTQQTWFTHVRYRKLDTLIDTVQDTIAYLYTFEKGTAPTSRQYYWEDDNHHFWVGGEPLLLESCVLIQSILLKNICCNI